VGQNGKWGMCFLDLQPAHFFEQARHKVERSGVMCILISHCSAMQLLVLSVEIQESMEEPEK